MKENKTEFINVRVSKREKEQLRSDSGDVGISKYLRKLIFGDEKD